MIKKILVNKVFFNKEPFKTQLEEDVKKGMRWEFTKEDLVKLYGKNILVLDDSNLCDKIILDSNILSTFYYNRDWNWSIYAAYLALKLLELWKENDYKVVEGYFYYILDEETYTNEHNYLIDKDDNIIDYTNHQFAHAYDLNSGYYWINEFNSEQINKNKIYTLKGYIDLLKKYPIPLYYSNKDKQYIWSVNNEKYDKKIIEYLEKNAVLDIIKR